MSTLTAKQQELLLSTPGLRLVRVTRFPKTSTEFLIGVTGTRHAALKLLNGDGQIELLKLGGTTRAQVEATIKRDKGKSEINLQRGAIIDRITAVKMLRKNSGKRPAFPTAPVI